MIFNWRSCRGDKILVANRGEIDVRVICTAHEMGKPCVAVYSTIDKDTLHVKLADESVCIGKAPSNQSYPDSIRVMGDKSTARDTMKNDGVPTVRGSDGLLQSTEEAVRLAEEIGYPVMIKEDTKCMTLEDADVSQEIRGGRKRNGFYLVVGSCCRGFADNKTSDVIYASAEVKQVGQSQMQYFWEAFLAEEIHVV
ncbi:hypothetical protein AgCh_026001 [Apium graveolens]